MIIHNCNIYTLKYGINKCPEKPGSKNKSGLEKLKTDKLKAGNYKLYILK